MYGFDDIITTQVSAESEEEKCPELVSEMSGSPSEVEINTGILGSELLPRPVCVWGGGGGGGDEGGVMTHRHIVSPLLQ